MDPQVNYRHRRTVRKYGSGDTQAKLAAVVKYRDQHLPGKPVWWTEFGYDTYANSPLHAPALGDNSAFVFQGQWLVRGLLAALAAGVERAMLFELDDTCTPPEKACDTQFATPSPWPTRRRPASRRRSTQRGAITVDVTETPTIVLYRP